MLTDIPWLRLGATRGGSAVNGYPSQSTAGRLPVVDNDYSIDMRALVQTIATTDVITMRFITVGHRLLLDFRSTPLDGPMIRVVDPVRSVRERYESLRQLRPRFDLPERIVSVAWPRFVQSLADSDVWRTVLERVVDSGDPSAVRATEETLRRVLELEAEHQREAITGDGFRTLWSASARQH